MTASNFTCKTVDPSISEDSFWGSVNILLNKPHVVNKRLWGCKSLFKCTCKSLTSDVSPDSEIRRLNNKENVEEYKGYLLQYLQRKDSSAAHSAAEIVLLELLPKVYSDSHAFQLVILQKLNKTVTFYDVTPQDITQNVCPDFCYSLQFNNCKVVLKADCDESSKSYLWLTDTVLPQFIKWREESHNQVEKQHICNESLCLVSNDKYYRKYNDLKFKYGKEMVKIWPECTDPSKFVYEDVAIASYLILLWEDDRNFLNLQHKQTFVDLGCGNGLLVYILTKEGYNGIGIDVRKRLIWDMYQDVQLKEKTITPSDIHLFPDTDWIIGNHSDELTPWIPVIAARSSYNCNFFLLPCCTYNFDGTKYQRQNSSKSQYTEYLQYIQKLCEDCGFRTDTDRLKIPSTKRICLVGRGRTYPEEEHNKYCNNIQDIITTGRHCNEDNHSREGSKDGNKDTAWIKDFKARDPVEKVRNCTQIDKTLIENIVHNISNYLLQGCRLESKWCEGQAVDLSEVVQLIPQENLKCLKSECGGLQTLLKNNHHIFKVQSGKVQLRHPKTVEEVTNSFKSSKTKSILVKVRQRPCWFYNNHPQGCPLADGDCSFLHVKC